MRHPKLGAGSCHLTIVDRYRIEMEYLCEQTVEDKRIICLYTLVWLVAWVVLNAPPRFPEVPAPCNNGQSRPRYFI